MTTIEDKINLFSKIIYDKVNEEKKQRLDAFNLDAKKKITFEKTRLDDLKKSLQKEAKKKSNIKSNAIVAKENLNKQREVLALKDNLIKDALESVRERLVKFTSTIEYKEYFISSIEKTLKAVDKGSYYIEVLKKDYDKFKSEMEVILRGCIDYNIEIKILDDDFIGGHVLKDHEGKFRIDSSIYSALQANKEKIGVRVMEMLS
ncbi:MAG: V-type ATP synthase subunit E [Clostridium sp.]|uniref:V-type ATP synthase subunit E n=1 Tax=Clostridium sp. TaxID=1506 RepID=UPI003D6D28BD